MRMTRVIAILFCSLFLLTSCGGLPSLAVKPISVDAKVGGEHNTGVEEDNMVKVQTGDTSQNEYISDTLQQTYNQIQEYPTWLILAFGLALGLALPSLGQHRMQKLERKMYREQIKHLLAQLHGAPVDDVMAPYRTFTERWESKIRAMYRNQAQTKEEIS